jgi:K+-sensing histidine kinase KdpD
MVAIVNKRYLIVHYLSLLRAWLSVQPYLRFSQEQIGVFAAFVSVALITLVGEILHPYLKYRNICMLYILAVLYVSTKFDWFPSLLTALLSLFAFNYFLDPPRFSLYTVDPQNLLAFSIVMLVSIVMSRRTLVIRRLAGNLEGQVRARTAELEYVNTQLGLEIATRRLNEQVQQEMLKELASRNATLEHFAKLTVHDLREPLRTVVGYGRLLRVRHGANLAAEVSEFLNHFDAGVERMERLIDGIGQLARLNTSSVPTMVPAIDFVNEALLNLAEPIERQQAVITIGSSLSEQLVLCDCKQMVHVCQNLISNALKFCRTQPQIAVDCRADEGRIVFSVSDNGIGIEPQYKQRLFQLFQRLHSRKEFPGIGLGLVLCKKIVESHGGEIWVESTASGGSCFSFTLPS